MAVLDTAAGAGSRGIASAAGLDDVYLITLGAD